MNHEGRVEALVNPVISSGSGDMHIAFDLNIRSSCQPFKLLSTKAEVIHTGLQSPAVGHRWIKKTPFALF